MLISAGFTRTTETAAAAIVIGGEMEYLGKTAPAPPAVAPAPAAPVGDEEEDDEDPEAMGNFVIDLERFMTAAVVANLSDS